MIMNAYYVLMIDDQHEWIYNNLLLNNSILINDNRSSIYIDNTLFNDEIGRIAYFIIDLNETIFNYWCYQ